MSEDDAGLAEGQGAVRILAGLAAEDRGESDLRPPLVLLHGLSFDRSMWRPALSELQTLDPGRRSLALDLPGHGDSASWPSHDIASVADGVHRAATEAGLDAPVVVGHSLAAIVASVYASRHPARGVINVDQSLETAPFATTLQSLADKLRGPDFPVMWDHFAASMHIELLPPAGQDLVRTTSRPGQDLVLSYWKEVLERPVEETAEQVAQGMALVRESGTPHVIVAGAEPDADYRSWLCAMLPQATVIVWPESGHFPHLAHPRDFAQVLASTADWA